MSDAAIQSRTSGTAIVTGGGSGIGRATALALLEAGWRVAIIGRREAPLLETVNGTPDSAMPLVADITDEAAISTAFELCRARFGRLDLLFNNAGVFGAGSPFEDTELIDWQEVIDTNLTGAFLCARTAYRIMKTQRPKGGRIINCGSLSAHAPRPHAVAYTASKHAITGLTRTIALEGRAHNIACGQIDVGNAATALTHRLAAGALQADGAQLAEPMMDARHVAIAVCNMAALPLDANVLSMTVMATAMPFVGRG